MTLDALLDRLKGVRRRGDRATARCPAHEDRQASLSVGVGDDGRLLVKCFAGCATEALLVALGLELRDLFPDDRGGGAGIPSRTPATAQPPTAGCTLAAYAEAKQLPLDFLRGLGLTDVVYTGAPAVRIPYLNPDGTETAVQFRLALEKSAAGDDRFRWKSGARPCLYGRWRLEAARRAGYLTIVEGVSDAQTLWFHDEPAVGLPGAASWREAWAADLDGIECLYVVVEPDRGGEATLAWVAKSRLRDRVRLIRDLGAKDPSALYLEAPDRFRERWRAALAGAEPWPLYQARRRDEGRTADWQLCRALAQRPRLLDDFAAAVERAGVAGERRAGQLLYLVLTSRVLERPASAVLKGPSSTGKSFLVEQVLRFFPPDAYHALSSMSERALAYSEEPLAHRVLVLYEAAGMGSDFASYLIRSLLSERRVRYETVEKTKAGLRPRLIEREGPTGLLVTTTAASLHPENETRLLSVTVSDTPDQTRAILRALARPENGRGVDVAPWQALQRWLAAGPREVIVPFAERLAEAIPPVAVRLRRDFGMLLTLIRTHALLHQASRERGAKGAVVATLEDYGVVRDLVGEFLADQLEATVSPAIRETVEAVKVLAAGSEEGVSLAALAGRLRLDRSAVSRRVRVALDRGYLKNLEDRKGRPARLVLGEPLPEAVAILPAPEALAEAKEGGEGASTPSRNTAMLQHPGAREGEPCSVAVVRGGKTSPPPPSVPRAAAGGEEFDL